MPFLDVLYNHSVAYTITLLLSIAKDKFDADSHYCTRIVITLWYYPTYDRIQFTNLDTWISLCIYTPFDTKTILSHSHFEDDSSTHISGSGFLIQIKPTFVLFKHVTFVGINYLETWSRWDNTSCYYTVVNCCIYRKRYFNKKLKT